MAHFYKKQWVTDAGDGYGGDCGGGLVAFPPCSRATGHLPTS